VARTSTLRTHSRFVRQPHPHAALTRVRLCPHAPQRLLDTGSELTKQHAAAAVESLAVDSIDNQLALAKSKAIAPLVALLASESPATQEHAVGALLALAAHSSDAVVRRLVAVLESRNAAAQMKAASALAALSSRSPATRKELVSAGAIQPLVRLLGDGRRTENDTPQERAAAVLADLARSGESLEVIADPILGRAAAVARALCDSHAPSSTRMPC
jgi:hypothetical protein